MNQLTQTIDARLESLQFLAFYGRKVLKAHATDLNVNDRAKILVELNHLVERVGAVTDTLSGAKGPA